MRKNRKISIPNATIDQMFEVIKALLVSQKSQDEIKKFLGLKYPPVHAIRALRELNVIEEKRGKYKLKEEYIQILKLGKENDKVKKLFENRLLEYQPFRAFIKIIEVNGGQIKKGEIGDYLEAELNSKWEISTKTQYVRVLLNWGEYANIIFVKGDNIYLNPKYAAAPIESFEIKDHSEIIEKYLYDCFCEWPLSKIIEEIKKFEEEINEKKKIGEIFERLLAHSFRILGFSVRKQSGIKEKDVGLSYDSREGGGDLGLFVHLPVKIGIEVYDGIAIAVEAKATRQGAPKKAIDQVRTLSEQIKKMYPNYYILKAVVSRSIGFDPYHARNKAFPDVVHIPYDVIKHLVEIQVEKFKQNKKLITPFEVITLLRKAIKKGNLEITKEYIQENLRISLQS